MKDWLFKLLFGEEYHRHRITAQSEADLLKRNRDLREELEFVRESNINYEKALLACCSKHRLNMDHPRLNTVLQTLDTLKAEANKFWRSRRPARFELDGGMPEAEIEQRLAGSEKTPVMQAVLAHLGAKVVALSDQATDSPHAALDSEMRVHLCGQASGVAGVLADLQRMAEPGEEEKK